MNWSEVQYFSAAEMACSHCGECHMNDRFMWWLDTLREAVGFALPVSSGYRCPIHDAAIGGAGVHTTGRAANLTLAGQQVHELVKTALARGALGVGLKQHGEWNSRFVHLDMFQDEHRPRIWTYL